MGQLEQLSAFNGIADRPNGKVVCRFVRLAPMHCVIPFADSDRCGIDRPECEAGNVRS